MKLSNANPVSTWMGERLTLPGAVDFLCICFSFSVPALFFFFFFSQQFVTHINNYVSICSADAFSYDMTRIFLSCTWADNIKL